MRLVTEKIHTVTFSVERFTGTEGGMNHEQFGEDKNTLAEAIDVLELAFVTRGDGWVIVCDVDSKIVEKK